MIRSLALCWLCLGSAWAQDAPEDSPWGPTEEVPVNEAPPVEDPLLPYRESLASLTERVVGTASKPVAYSWRTDTIQFGVIGSFPFQLNTFNNARVGGLVRVPNRMLMWEFGASYAESWDSAASRSLAFTPYRQAGQPDRLDLDVSIILPAAEGVVTTFPKFFPAVQMVFNFHAGMRYSIYPKGFKGLRFGKVVEAVLSPALSQDEVDNLNDARLGAMEVDRGRYALVSGISNDLYFEQGVFLSPRMMFHVPVLAGASQTNLYFWVDVQLVVGMSF